MLSYTTTTTFGTTGTAAKTITPGFLATCITLRAAPATGLSAGAVIKAHGWTDGTRKSCDYIYGDGTKFKSEMRTDKLLQLWDDDGAGTLVKVLEATLNSITATQVSFDVTYANSNYQVSIKCEG